MADMVGKHFRYVEAHIDVLPAHPREKPARDIRVAPLLVPLHRLGRRTEFLTKTGLHLAENDGVFAERHDVRFAEGGLVIELEDLVTLLFQKFCGAPLSFSAEIFFRKDRLCIGHGPNSLTAARCSAVPYPLFRAKP